MLQKIAFYAPLKPPDHPVPSGDRTMARGLIDALRGFPSNPQVDLVSKLRTRDGAGDSALQKRIIREAGVEIDRLLTAENSPRWQVWMTYHNYYKAPDLIGPTVSRELGIPYVLVEASRAKKRLTGNWAEFAKLAEQASDAADCIFYMTDRDYPALAVAKPDLQTLVRLHPFLNQSRLPELPEIDPVEKSMIAVGMLRDGDKLKSYEALAEALGFITTPDWTLKIIGDGPASSKIKDLFSNFGSSVTFLGLLDSEQVSKELAKARVFVWPGINEAFGMVYLEAQSHGLTVIAEDLAGVRDVVGPSGFLTEPTNPESFARSIDLAFDSAEPRKIGVERGRNYIAQRHLRPSATRLLEHTLVQQMEKYR